MEMHVRYLVGGQKKEEKNVGLAELQAGLKELVANETTHRQIDALLGVKDYEADEDLAVGEWITQLNGYNLALTEDILCKTNFPHHWWRSKTRAGKILCLLNAHIEAQKVKAKEEIDKTIRNFSTNTISTTTPSPAVAVSDKEVEAWLRNWERQNRTI